MSAASVRRGEVHLLDLSPDGSRRKKRRPVLGVQHDVGNRYSSETIVAAIRDPHDGGELPVFVVLAPGEGGLRRKSVVDAGRLCTVPQESLRIRLGALSPAALSRVEHALRLSLGLTS